MDGAILESGLAHEGLVFHRVQSPLLLARDAERHHVARDRALQFFGRAFGDDLSVIDDRDPIAQRVRFVEVVGGQEDSGPAVVHATNLIPYARPALRIKPGRRLIEKQQLRSMHQAEPDIKAPLLAAGIGADLAVSRTLQLEHLDQLGRALLSPGGRHAVEAALEDQLRAACDLAVGATRLADVTDALADPARLRRELASRDASRATAGGQQ